MDPTKLNLNLNVENQPTLPVEQQHALLTKIFQVTVSTPPQPGLKFLPTLSKQLSDVASIVGAFGGKPAAVLIKFSSMTPLMNEIAPNEKGFPVLLQCEARLLAELKKEKGEPLEFLKAVEKKLIEGCKFLILEEQYRIGDWKTTQGPCPSALRDLFDSLTPDFLTKLVNACSEQEIQVAFSPVVTEWVFEMGQLCDHGDITKDETMIFINKVSKITEYPALIRLFTEILFTEVKQASSETGKEMELRSLLANFLGMNVCGPAAARYFNQIQSYPMCTQDAVSTKQIILREALANINKKMHDNMKKLFLCKVDNGRPQQVLLSWISKYLELNEILTTARPHDPLYFELISTCSSEGFLTNLAAVLMLFCKPLIDAPEKFVKQIPASYLRYSKIIDYGKHARVCESVQHIYIETEQAQRDGQFAFIPHIFFLTFEAIHVGFLPAFENYKNRLSALNQAKASSKDLETQFGTGWASTPIGTRVKQQLVALYPLVDGHEVQLGDPDILKSIMGYFSLAMQWMCKIISDNTLEHAASIYSDMPEYFIKDTFDVLDFISRLKTKILAEAHLPVMFNFCITLLNRPDLIRSPLLRARMAILLSTFQALYHQPKFKGNAFQLKHQSYILNEEEKLAFGNVFLRADEQTTKKLITGLMRIYIDIGDVEGLDVDKDKMDKYSVRRDICDMLNKLWPTGDFKKVFLQTIKSANSSDQLSSEKFLSTVLSDSIMLLDDSLHRLYDIKSLQEAMANTAEWNSQDQKTKMEREAYYKGQERSSKAFLQLATEILDFLINVSLEASLMFQTPEMMQKLVSMLIYFLGKLCGPQMSKLKVKNPEKYGFDPKQLLGKIAKILAHFAESPEMSKKMGADLDYDPLVMDKACQILSRIKVLDPQLEAKFQNFVKNTNQLKPAAAPAQADWQFPTIEIPNQEQNTTLEKEYVDIQSLRIFDSFNMTREEGLFNHHYNDNIIANATSAPQRTQQLRKECRQLTTQLPISRGSSVFVRTHTDRIDVMKAIITGPQGTPYGFGAFLFDIFFPADYPRNPPLVNLETTGHGTVRFNPNLYTDGKVCLSLLGTWHGDENSKWKPLKSNLCQVLISIQGLILVQEPYYNEPSYEAQRGTKEGDEASAKYNEQLQYNNIRYAMVEQIKNPSAGFEDVIHNHFYLQKDAIMLECKSWYEAATDKPKMLKAIQQLQEELLKLKPVEIPK